MSLGLMTPIHPKWDDFLDRLEGPDGCNFRDVVRNGKKDSTWDCDNTPNRPIARKHLAALGATSQEIEQSLGFFHAFGGHCDCEIAFNVQDSFESYMGRGRRRRNP